MTNIHRRGRIGYQTQPLDPFTRQMIEVSTVVDDNRGFPQAMQPWLAMTSATLFSSLLGLLILTVIAVGVILYFRFSSSQEKRWATQVLHLVREAEKCVSSENRLLRSMTRQRDAELRALQEGSFSAQLNAISLNALEAYPGIGPATIAKLRAAGFYNLATLEREHIRIPGLGQKRLADINNAVRDLLARARKAFESGDCRQARSLADRMGEIASRYDIVEEKARSRTRAARDLIDRLAEEVEYAGTVSFWRWLRPRSYGVLVPAEIMKAPLPDFDSALQAASAPPQAIPVAQVAPATSLLPRESTREERLELLEITADMSMSPELVRRQWNLLSDRYSPEKVASLGKEFVSLAQTKLAALRQAAESVLKEMGEQLETIPPVAPAPDSRHNPDLDAAFGGM